MKEKRQTQSEVDKWDDGRSWSMTILLYRSPRLGTRAVVPDKEEDYYNIVL